MHTYTSFFIKFIFSNAATVLEIIKLIVSNKYAALPTELQYTYIFYYVYIFVKVITTKF